MSGKLENISMMGRMAYVIMCVEKYLLNKYPNRNWKLLSEILWNFMEIHIYGLGIMDRPV